MHSICHVEPEGQFPAALPRLGITFELPKVDRVEWFGTGPNEAYVDTRAAAAVGKYSATVDQLQTPYVRPQENGHRIDTRWVPLDGLRVEAAPDLFGLTVRDWTTADLENATHAAALLARDTTYVTLDLAQTGVGSNSCGPALPDRDKLHTAPATLTSASPVRRPERQVLRVPQTAGPRPRSGGRFALQAPSRQRITSASVHGGQMAMAGRAGSGGGGGGSVGAPGGG